jgi:hypothetical protein
MLVKIQLAFLIGEGKPAETLAVNTGKSCLLSLGVIYFIDF